MRGPPIAAHGQLTPPPFVDISRSITWFGGVNDGATNNDAAFTKAITNATGPVNILIPAGPGFVISGTVFFATTQVVNLIGQGIGVSKIIISPAATFGSGAAQLFKWSNVNGVRVSGLTVDVNGSTSAAVNTSFSMSILFFGLCSNTMGADVAVINMTAGMGGISMDGPTRFWLLRNYITQTASHSNGKGLWIGSSSGTPSGGVIDGNTLIGTNTLIDGNGHRIINNDISGWGYGSAVGLGISIANLANNRDNVVANNYLHDSMVGQDTSSAYASGVENWAQRTTITGNVVCRNSGTGIGNGGLNAMISGNLVFGNGTGGVNQAGIGGAASGGASPAGTIYSGNRVFDDGSGFQLWGYQDFNAGLGAQTFSGNDFTGNVTGAYNFTNANAPNVFFIPAHETFYNLPAGIGSNATVTLDTVLTVTIPANKLGADNDKMHIRAGGTFAATTDAKTVQFKLGSTVLWTGASSVAAQSCWSVDIWFHRRTSGSEDWTAMGSLQNNGNANATLSGTTGLAMTSANDVTVLMQDATAATANAVRMEQMTIEIFHQTR